MRGRATQATAVRFARHLIDGGGCCCRNGRRFGSREKEAGAIAAAAAAAHSEANASTAFAVAAAAAFAMHFCWHKMCTAPSARQAGGASASIAASSTLFVSSGLLVRLSVRQSFLGGSQVRASARLSRADGSLLSDSLHRFCCCRRRRCCLLPEKPALFPPHRLARTHAQTDRLKHKGAQNHTRAHSSRRCCQRHNPRKSTDFKPETRRRRGNKTLGDSKPGRKFYEKSILACILTDS